MTNTNITINDNSKIESYKEEITGYIVVYADYTLPSNIYIKLSVNSTYEYPELAYTIYKPRYFEDFSNTSCKAAFPVFTVMIDAFKMHISCDNATSAGIRILKVKSKHYRDVSYIYNEAYGKLYDCNMIEVIDEVDENELKGYAIELYDRGVYFKNNIDRIALTHLGLGCWTMKDDMESEAEIYVSKNLYSPYTSIRRRMMSRMITYLFKYLKTFNGNFKTEYETIEQLFTSIKDCIKDMSDDEKKEILDLMYNTFEEDK